MGHASHRPHVNTVYSGETERRMVRAISELQAILRYGSGDIEAVLHLMHEQEKASQRACFHDVAAICRGLTDGIAEVRLGTQPWLVAVATTLLDSCQAIRVNADSIARSLPQVRSAHKPVRHCRTTE